MQLFGYIYSYYSHNPIYINKKQKQVYTIGWTNLQLLLLHYNFYKQKSKNNYIQLVLYTYSYYCHICN